MPGGQHIVVQKDDFPAVRALYLLPGGRRVDIALLAGDYAPGATADTAPGQKANGPLIVRVDAVVRRGGLHLGRQAGVVLVARPASDDFVRVDYSIEIRGKREYLGQIHPVVVGEPVPPLHTVTLGFVPGRQAHQGQIGESAVAVHIHKGNVHVPTSQPWAMSWLTWEV